eukprot:Awhi_evm1s4864
MYNPSMPFFATHNVQILPFKNVLILSAKPENFAAVSNMQLDEMSWVTQVEPGKMLGQCSGKLVKTLPTKIVSECNLMDCQELQRRLQSASAQRIVEQNNTNTASGGVKSVATPDTTAVSSISTIATIDESTPDCIFISQHTPSRIQNGHHE